MEHLDNYTPEDINKLLKWYDRQLVTYYFGSFLLFLLILYIPYLLLKETLIFYDFPMILLYDFIAIILSFVLYKILNRWYPRPQELSKLLKTLKYVVISWIVFYLFYFWGFLWHFFSLFIPWTGIIGIISAFSAFINLHRYFLFCLLIVFLLIIIIIFILILRLRFWSDEYYVNCSTKYEIMRKVRKRKKIYFYYCSLLIFNCILVILSSFAAYFQYKRDDKWIFNQEVINIGEIDLAEEKDELIGWWKQEAIDFSNIMLRVMNKISD